MTRNFVSISGVSDRRELEEISRIYRDEGMSFPLVIGYQLSNKSINQGTNSPRQPSFSDLGELDKETRDNGFITAIHYYTRDHTTISSDLEKVAELVDASAALVQFNTLPPSLDILRKIKEMNFRVIFKVAVSNKQEGGYAVWKGEGVQDVSTGQTGPLLEQVIERKGYIDYAMFDPSHGTNLGLNLKKNSLAVRFGKEILACPDLGVGLVYAGGIGPDNARQITKSLHSFFPNAFSIDSESGLRTNDQLDFHRVRDYLTSCRAVMEQDGKK